MKIQEVLTKPIKECTTAGAIAVAIPSGGGFKNGGPGMISRTSKKKKSKR